MDGRRAIYNLILSLLHVSDLPSQGYWQLQGVDGGYFHYGNTREWGDVSPWVPLRMVQRRRYNMLRQFAFWLAQQTGPSGTGEHDKYLKADDLDRRTDGLHNTQFSQGRRSISPHL